MAFEEEKILLKSKLCTQESFIVWCRSRFLLYNVIKELNCKDLLSFDLLGVLHSCTLLPMQIASEQSKVKGRKLDLLPENLDLFGISSQVRISGDQVGSYALFYKLHK